MPPKKPAPSGPKAPAYLVSYGDTMTTLLAFFIVLVSLAKEQTGANLHAGTGSFVRAVESFGLPGVFGKKLSRRAAPFDAAGPSYLLEEANEPAHDNSLGPDHDADSLPILDRESERLQQFLNQMGRLAEHQQQPGAQARATFDIYEPLGKKPPYLAPAHRTILAQTLPALKQPDCRVFLIVWATTPSDTAWRRAAMQANAAAEHLVNAARLDHHARARLVALGQPWPHSHTRRPVMSIIVARVR